MGGGLVDESEDYISPIDDEDILKLAQQIDTDSIYEKVMKLYNIKWKLQINVSMKKMDQIF